MIQFIRLVLEDLLLHVLPFLNAGNLCQLKFVNNEDLPNTGNLDFTLRQGGTGGGGGDGVSKEICGTVCLPV